MNANLVFKSKFRDGSELPYLSDKSAGAPYKFHEQGRILSAIQALFIAHGSGLRTRNP